MKETKVPLGRWQRKREWIRRNWQALLFWVACAFAGWYLGARGYGMALYFRLAGIGPEDRDPFIRLTAQKDPKVGTVVSLEGLTDWQGRPVKLPFPDKTTALAFICGACGLEEFLNLMQEFHQRHGDRVRVAIVYIGHPSEDLFQIWQTLKGMVLVRDPKLSVFERLNALYMPRLYLIAPDGTLRYLSPLSARRWTVERWQKELERVKAKL